MDTMFDKVDAETLYIAVGNELYNAQIINPSIKDIIHAMKVIRSGFLQKDRSVLRTRIIVLINIEIAKLEKLKPRVTYINHQEHR